MSVSSFAEESCWNDQTFRPVRKAVTFRIESVGKIQGTRVDHVFEADFGLWYDPDDQYLLAKLDGLELDVSWRRYVFWKKLDHSQIDVLEVGDEERVVATIKVRGRSVGDPVGEADLGNVVDLGQFRLAREEKE